VSCAFSCAACVINLHGWITLERKREAKQVILMAGGVAETNIS
jgi:hypothetical protein